MSAPRRPKAVPEPITRDIDREALLALLRDHLKIEIEDKTFSDFSSKGVRLTVRLLLDDETISQCETEVDVATRGTSEDWRSSFD